MNGLQGPSDADLAKRMEKRMDQAKFEKRFNRNGVNSISIPSDEGSSIEDVNVLSSNE